MEQSLTKLKRSALHELDVWQAIAVLDVLMDRAKTTSVAGKRAEGDAIKGQPRDSGQQHEAA